MVNGESWWHRIDAGMMVVSMTLEILTAAVCKVISTSVWIRHLALIIERLNGSMPSWIERHRLGRIGSYG